MKIEVVEIGENDVVMIHHSIGNMPPGDVDKYSEKLIKNLTSIFGRGRVAFFPVRDGYEWDFTLIKRPKKEVKKVAKK
jgi:hypothetical protein